ncbi:MAG: hypothetical protein HYV27_17560 [Candidatus Hydrogenedentes bacterium]|nr:hypothetical protein [Candidatus Hydrogenedentota bacterium]
MAGIPSIGGIGAAQFQAQYQAATLKLQKDAIDLQGDLALQLIASASVPTGTGQNLDLQI